MKKTIIALSIIMIFMISLCSCYKEEFVSVEMLKNKALSGDEAAVRKLIDLVDANDIKTQSEAYEAIISVGAKAVEILMDELEKAGGEKKEYIVAALGMIKDKKAVGKLVAILKGNDKRRYAAAFALGHIADTKAVRALVDALDDNDAEVKKYAAISLIKINNSDTGMANTDIIIKELTRFFGSTDVLDKNFALSVAGEIKDGRIFDAVLKEVGGRHKEQAIWALGKLKDTRAVKVLAKELTDPDWRIRVAAARSLGSIHSEDAVTALERNLSDKNVFVREWAARALEDITGRDYEYTDEEGKAIIPTSLYR